MLDNLWSRVDGIARVLSPPGNTKTTLQFQARQLRRLVRHCFDNVEYYNQAFRRAGLRPGDIRGLDDLPKIPLTSREDIQNCSPGNICPRGVRPGSLLIRKTSGSSGAPLTIRRGWFEEQLLLALRKHSSLAGMSWPLLRRKVQLFYEGSDMPWKRKLRGPSWHGRLGLFPKTYIDWRMPRNELIDRIAELRPGFLGGPPSLLSWLADELTEEERRRIRPQLVGTGGELCTDLMRRQIENGFGAPLFEGYGSHEFVGIAQRLPGEARFRVLGYSLIVEILQDGQSVAPGEAGELVGTALHSFSMPFLRYRLGDLVRRGAADQSHPHSVFQFDSMHGRVIDRFALRGGQYVHPYTVANVLRDDAPWVRRFQIVQTERNEFWLRIVTYQKPGEEALDALCAQVRNVFPEAVSVRIELVDELITTATGKFYPYVALERYLNWGNKPEP